MADWVLIEQSEGLMVEFDSSPDVGVFFVDYDECSENRDYVHEKLNELDEVFDGVLPEDTFKRVRKTLTGYL